MALTMKRAFVSSTTTTTKAPLAPRSLVLPRRPRRAPTVATRAAAVAIAPEYGYVMAAVAVNAAMLQWQAIRVAIARKKYGVSYPQMYAEGRSEEATVFNCVQRAHQNTLEYAPAMTALVALLGFAHPLYAAALDAAWVAGRVAYTLGYSTGLPDKRLPGAAASGLAYVAAIASCLVTGARTTGLLPL